MLSLFVVKMSIFLCPCIIFILSLLEPGLSQISKTFSFCHQGEAKSAQLIGQAISNNPAFIALRAIEASMEIAQLVSASNNKVYLNADELLLNLHQIGDKK